jgi:hypothetical protein
VVCLGLTKWRKVTLPPSTVRRFLTNTGILVKKLHGLTSLLRWEVVSDLNLGMTYPTNKQTLRRSALLKRPPVLKPLDNFPSSL